jgi:hypothetical protein
LLYTSAIALPLSSRLNVERAVGELPGSKKVTELRTLRALSGKQISRL